MTSAAMPPPSRGTRRRPTTTAPTWALIAALALAAASSRAQPDGAPAGEASAASGERTRSLDEAALLGPPQGRPLAGTVLDAATRTLGERMRCPVCQGLSIADSPSASAVAMLGEVRDLLARGYTEQQVLDYFVGAYGEFVLLQPTARGWNLLVWVLPFAAVLAGALLIARRLRATRGRGPGGSSDPGSGDDELDPYLDRVRSEVRR